MMIYFKKIIGLSMITASLLYGASSDGTYTNVYGVITNGGNTMSDDTYKNYGVLSGIQNRVVATDGTYSNYAKLEILNGGTTEEPSTNTGGGTTGGATTPPPTSEPEEPIIVEPDPEPTPDPEAPIVVVPDPEPTPNTDNSSIFDDDRQATDSVTIVVTDNEEGSDNTKTLDTQETNIQIDSVIERPSETSTAKEYVVASTTTTGETKERIITIDRTDAVMTTTQRGTEISTQSVSEGRSTKTTLELNTNGTSVMRVNAEETSPEGSQTTRSSAIASTRADVTTNVAQDGSVEVQSDQISDESGSTNTTKARLSSDGTTQHSVTRKSVEGVEISTVARSKANNTLVTFLEDGTVQTRVDSTQEDGSKTTVAVDGRSDGSASHILRRVDANGNTVSTRATSEIPGAQTDIEEDGTVQTQVKPNERTSLKVKANADGSATHEVELQKEDGQVVTTRATSTIPGANTRVTTDGSVETTATVKRVENGEEYEIRAVVKSLVNGGTISKFEKVNLTTGEIQELDNTVSESTPLEEGNEVEIKEDGEKLLLEATTKVSNEIIFE